MSFKKTLVLAILLCGLIYAILRFEIPAREEEAKKDVAFKNLDKSKLESIEIVKPDGAFVIKNAQPGVQNGKWELAGLVGSFLDSSAINGLLTALSELKLDSVLPKEDVENDLSVYGLKEPALALNIKGEPTNQVLIGKKSEYLGKYYLKLASSENIYLVPETLLNAAGKSKDEFRDKSPLGFFDSEIKFLTIKNSSSTTKLERSTNGDWLIVSPISVSASNNSVSEYLRNLRNLSVIKFIDSTEKISDYKFENGNLTVLIEYNNVEKPSEEVVFSKLTKDKKDSFYFYVKGGPSIFEAGIDPYEKLSVGQDYFREKNLFNFATDLVKGVEAEEDGQLKITALKDNNEWKVNGKNGDKVFLDQWLSNLSDLTAHSFPSKSVDYGFEKPKYKVSITIGEGKRNLLIGNKINGDAGAVLYYAAADYKTSGGLDNPFIITEDSYKKIALKEEALIAVAPTPVP